MSLALYFFPLCVTDRHLLNGMVQLPLCRLFLMTFTTAFMKSANKCLSLLLNFCSSCPLVTACMRCFHWACPRPTDTQREWRRPGPSPVWLAWRSCFGAGGIEIRILSNYPEDRETAASDKEMRAIELEYAIPPYLKHNRGTYRLSPFFRVTLMLTTLLTPAPMAGWAIKSPLPFFVLNICQKTKLSTRNFQYLSGHQFYTLFANTNFVPSMGWPKITSEWRHVRVILMQSDYKNHSSGPSF